MAIEDLGFESDPVPLAFDLMRATLRERPTTSVDERLQFVRDLAAQDQDDAELLGKWLRRAIQD